MSREIQFTREHSSDRRSQLAELSPRPVFLCHVILARYVLSDEEEGVLCDLLQTTERFEW